MRLFKLGWAAHSAGCAEGPCPEPLEPAGNGGLRPGSQARLASVYLPLNQLWKYPRYQEEGKDLKRQSILRESNDFSGYLSLQVQCINRVL